MSSKSAAKTRTMVLDTHDANMFVTGDKPALPAPRSSRGSQSVRSTQPRGRPAPPRQNARAASQYAASLTGLPSEGASPARLASSPTGTGRSCRASRWKCTRQQAGIKAQEREPSSRKTRARPADVPHRAQEATRQGGEKRDGRRGRRGRGAVQAGGGGEAGASTKRQRGGSRGRNPPSWPRWRAEARGGGGETRGRGGGARRDHAAARAGAAREGQEG